MVEKTVPTTQENGGKITKETTRSNQNYVIPPVDIYEEADRLVVIADLPGADRDHINVNVEDNVLTLEATTQADLSGDVVYREFEMVNFYRQFQLSEHVDVDKISANLNNGVLTLSLPKAEKAKPRQIEVKAE